MLQEDFQASDETIRPPINPSSIQYSDKYCDDKYEYR